MSFRITNFEGVTLNGASKFYENTLLNSLGDTITLPDHEGTLATIGGRETLTNKTLETPTISSPTLTNTLISDHKIYSNSTGIVLDLPTSTDTLVGRATTDVLTNKTLTTPIIETIRPSTFLLYQM